MGEPVDLLADATELRDAIAAGRLASEELLDALLERIERHNPTVNAVVALDVDRARTRARAADRALAAGERWGPLHGLPMTVKDSYETEGLVTTSGAPELRGHVPARDATAVARLRAAGAVVFGKTNLPLYAGDLQSYNEVYGTTSNPWDPSRTPGGSSGGAAAALATGMTPLELGSDIGGSIRQPSSFTGVFGLKPSFGIVATRGHIPGPPGSLLPLDINAAGPMARSARDLDLALGVLAGPGEDDEPAWRIELPPPRAAGTGLRIRVLLDSDGIVTASEVGAALRAAVDRLSDSGVDVEEADAEARALVAEGAEFSFAMVAAAMSPWMADDVFEMACQLDAVEASPDEPFLFRAGRAVAMRHRAWLAADERRRALRSRWAAWFERADVLLAPVHSTAAFEHQHDGEPVSRTIVIDGEEVPYMQNRWATAFGAVYLPAASVPAARTASGLPVGLQVVGPYLHDRTVLAAAELLEERLGGFEPPPGFG